VVISVHKDDLMVRLHDNNVLKMKKKKKFSNFFFSHCRSDTCEIKSGTGFTLVHGVANKLDVI